MFVNRLREAVERFNNLVKVTQLSSAGFKCGQMPEIVLLTSVLYHVRVGETQRVHNLILLQIPQSIYNNDLYTEKIHNKYT